MLCPHCAQPIEDGPRLAEGLVACPFCLQPLSATTTVAAKPTPSVRGGTALFIVGLVLAAVAALPILACGGCLLEYALRPKSEHAKAVEARDAAASEFALPHLKKHGIESLGDDAISIAADGQILLIATGFDSTGKRHQVNVFIKGIESQPSSTWQLDRIDLDGKLGVNAE